MNDESKKMTLADYGQIKRCSYDEVMSPEEQLEIEKCINLFEACERKSIDTIAYVVFKSMLSKRGGGGGQDQRS